MNWNMSSIILNYSTYISYIMTFNITFYGFIINTINACSGIRIIDLIILDI